MKDLEDEVAPLLGPMATMGTRIIVPGTHRSLVRWTLKTAAVAQELPPNTIKPIGPAVCAYLMAAQEPPPGATGWILPSPEPEMDAFCMLATFGVGDDELGYVTNVLVGKILLAVIGPVGGPRGATSAISDPWRFCPSNLA